MVCMQISGKPEGLKNCSTVNQTYESLTIVCGGDPVTSNGNANNDHSFILEVNRRLTIAGGGIIAEFLYRDQLKGWP